MRMNVVGNKRDHVLVVVKSAEASATIPAGSPVVLVVNGTDDGLGVVLPATAGAAKTNALLMGITVAAIAPNVVGEAVAFGITNALFNAGTIASTTSFASTSFAAGVILCVDTVNNCLQSQSASLASTAYMPYAILASSVLIASGTTGTVSLNKVSAEVFIRNL